MAPMTVSTATTEPYWPYAPVSYLPSGMPLRLVATFRYVDNGLSEAEREAVSSEKQSRRLLTVAFLQWLIPLGILAFLLGAVSIAKESASGPIATAAGLAMLVTGISAEVYLRREKKRIDARIAGLEARGVLIEDRRGTDADLLRVCRALRALHGIGNTSLDDQARAAVDKIIHQNDHRPSEKQKAIAASGANDSASAVLRKEATTLHNRWSTDVAEAELALRELEAAAAEQLGK